MDKKDLFSFFIDLKNEYEDHEMMNLFENYEISKLDIHRIYRYLDKYTKENVKTVEEEVIEELEVSKISERGATRLDDRISPAGMEDRKRQGYF
jgi:3'-phosphoadenosine 5'-phosphosulfate sulfotransferase (PAPS reductase)/FAD synthetase